MTNYAHIITTDDDFCSAVVYFKVHSFGMIRLVQSLRSWYIKGSNKSLEWIHQFL